MEQRVLGSTGVTVSAVGLGTYRVFNVRDDAGTARCEAVVDAALEGGANLFDSSPMYGEAERVLCDALVDRRDQAVVATKVWGRDRAVGEVQIERALAWFGCVDVYQVHNLVFADEHLPRLLELKSSGRVRAIGATHYLPSAFPELLARMRSGELDVVQVPYHPLERTAEREVLPEAERLGIGVIAMTPLAAGRLVSTPPEASELAPLAPFGVQTWPQAILKWVLSDPRVHAVIPATHSPDHMRENAVAGSPPWFGGGERTYIRQLAARLSSS